MPAVIPEETPALAQPPAGEDADLAFELHPPAPLLHQHRGRRRDGSLAFLWFAHLDAARSVTPCQTAICQHGYLFTVEQIGQLVGLLPTLTLPGRTAVHRHRLSQTAIDGWLDVVRGDGSADLDREIPLCVTDRCLRGVLFSCAQYAELITAIGLCNGQQD